MTAHLLKWLGELGLDEQRSLLYLCALRLGEGTPSQLASELGIGRTAIYDNLQQLERRGFVSKISRGKRSVYVPLHPEQLKSRIDAHAEQLRSLLPDLTAMFGGASRKPFVQLFQGALASREVYEDILRSGVKEYRYVSSPDVTYSTVNSAYIRRWVQQRVKQGVSSKALRTTGSVSDRDPHFRKDPRLLRDVRYLPTGLELACSLYIYGNNLGVITSRREYQAFIIYSPDFARSMTVLFDHLWMTSARR